MAEKDEKKVEKVAHANVYAAIAGFQGENPVLEKTKEFGKATDKMHFWYCPLDEMLRVCRPFTSKHGLAIIFEEGKVAGTMVCALYHETYAKTGEIETGVVRSMAIKVKRDGDMKEIGGNSTYASRYTMKEVLGLAPDEDQDVQMEEARAEKLEHFAIANIRKSIVEVPYTELAGKLSFLQKNLKLVEEGKVGNLGLNKEQYIEMIALVEKRIGDEMPQAPGNGDNGNGVVDADK